MITNKSNKAKNRQNISNIGILRPTVTFNLHNDTYHPYKKPNDNPSYIHTSSNHIPHIIRQLPDSINERLSRN